MDTSALAVTRWLRPPRTVAILTAVVFVGCAVYAIRTGWPPRYADEEQYLQIAQALGGGQGFQLDGSPTAYRPPAWPLLLTPFVALAEPSQWLILVPVALLGLSAVLAGMIVSRITGSGWGWLAAPMTLIYPLNLYTASTLYPQLLATALLLAMWTVVIGATTRWHTEPELGRGRAALLGVLAAALGLAVPTMIFTGMAIAAWALWQQRSQRFRAGVVMAGSFAVPIVAWSVRNLLVLGAFIPLSSSSGQNLLIGNNPSATATSGMDVDISAAIGGAGGLGEAARDTYYRRLAMEWILQHPVDALLLWLGKLANYFNPYNAPVTAGQGDNTTLWIAWLSYLVLIAAVVARLVLRRIVPIWRSEWLILVLYLLNAPVMAVFFTRTRFRQPLDAGLVVIAAVAVTAVGVRLSKKRLNA